MDVLNTYGGEFNIGLTLLGIFLVVVAAYAIFFMFSALWNDYFGFAAVFAISAVIAVIVAVVCFTFREPVRHEVTLRPGYVIDATKYEIVEQRGEIYVIEERNRAE